ncbi:hypothetical protein Dsin_021352 [Dipteronia sinensis]|uniref:Reverse transcriptase domain-containing protein n=1 Tax=Dipteronia sinensis TaxID=43782 RepID=A0AAE0E049_9ROSI|nr:hypothetical protein Dsin_021352 [Dipteronia sinensis]
MYKVLANMLSNRLKDVMDSINGETQMAFIKNNQILDSFVIAKEIIQLWKKDNNSGLHVKVDFEKAYDSVDHGFLDSMMRDMDFSLRWRQWMKNCIATPMLSVLVNGSHTSQFGKERVLHQGNLISPFLFNIVTESLSSVLRKAIDLGLISGATFGNNEVYISHLQFADDMIIFLKSRLEYLCKARRILRCFELVMGLRINFHKSYVVKIDKKKTTEDGWADAFKSKKATLPITYLCLPLGARPNTKSF